MTRKKKCRLIYMITSRTSLIKRPQDKNASIEFLFKEMKDNPESLRKKLTNGEREATD
jgi:hypothetical protein